MHEAYKREIQRENERHVEDLKGRITIYNYFTEGTYGCQNIPSAARDVMFTDTLQGQLGYTTFPESYLNLKKYPILLLSLLFTQTTFKGNNSISKISVWLKKEYKCLPI